MASEDSEDPTVASGLLWAPTPIPCPPPQHTFEEVTTGGDTMSAIDAGWLEKDVSGKLRGERTQSTYVKLFYARYFHVSGDQLATALGDSLRSREQADEHATYKKAAERLDNVWKIMRVRTFGKESYLNALVRHTVELHDFMVVTSNLARLERIENATVRGESEDERVARRARRDEYKATKEDHITRLADSRTAEVARAQRKLDTLRSSTLSKPTARPVLEAAIADLEHCKGQNVACRPMIEHGYTSSEYLPPALLSYGQQSLIVRQKFWEKKWSKDMGAALLWPVRNDIDIPATLKQGNDYYAAVFVTFAMDAWRFCLGVVGENERLNRAFARAGYVGVHIAMEGEELRPSHVYPGMKGVNSCFPSLPGLGLLQLPVTARSKVTKKRKADDDEEFSGGYFGTQKR